MKSNNVMPIFTVKLARFYKVFSTLSKNNSKNMYATIKPAIGPKFITVTAWRCKIMDEK